MQEAQYELSKAAPLLEEATRVLKELKTDDFYFIAAIKSPTGTIVLGMEVACLMMNHKPGKPGEWFNCARKNLLNNPKLFMQRMIDYDKEHIPE